LRIAFSGKMGAGKTTLRNQLEQEGFCGFALADPIKWLAEVQLMSVSQWDSELNSRLTQLFPTDSVLRKTMKPMLKKAFITYPPQEGKNRRLLQHIGTDIGRKLNPVIWVNALTNMVKNLGDVVVDDVRFNNEVDGLHRAGFCIIRLNVSRETQEERLIQRDGALPALESFDHISETELDQCSQFDWVINADRPLEDVLHELYRIIDWIRKGEEIYTGTRMGRA
jgi:dephospho-CoA kinase